MRKKIIASYILLILVLTISFSLIMMNSFNHLITLQIRERFSNEGLLVKELFVSQYQKTLTADHFDFQGFADEVGDSVNTRVTIITDDGTVIADTHEKPENMNNHLNRDEVSKAIKNNALATSIRFSSTVEADFMYVAVPVQMEDAFFIIRVAKEMVELKLVNEEIVRVAMISILMAAAIASLISVVISKRITDPIDALTEAANEISNGDFGRKIYITAHDQIGELAEAFNKMSFNLNASMLELKQRNSELEAILNSIISGIIAVDQNKNILLINKVCFDILELPEASVKQHESMYKIVRNEEIAAMVEASMLDGLSQVKELPYVHIDKILRIYVNPILSTSKEIMGSIVVIQDVTQIRKLEQMRSDFVSNVSHELKTPLTSIKGFVDTLKNGAISNPVTANRFLDIIDIESERLYRLINDILLLSEIESMTGEAEHEPVDLNGVVDEVYDMLEHRAEEKNLELILDCDSDLVFLGNRDRLKQLFINLVDNAIKYTEVGTVRVVVKNQEDHIVIKVIDTGVGFAEIHKERLFERFYRVDKGRSRNQGGTGLGLSIVKHIVLLYKGKITVNSKLGEGTVFEVTLPLNKETQGS